MLDPQFLLAIDQGTTSTKALILDRHGRVLGAASSRPIEAHHPQAGWVEYDPEEMLDSVFSAAQHALNTAGLPPESVAGIGLANQGETVIGFDGSDGRPIYRAISWQDRRSEELVGEWRTSGLEARVEQLTGLRLDPYFAAGKMAWLVRHAEAARELMAHRRLHLATSDSWLLWQLTGGRSYITDVATASRTMLLSLSNARWSSELAQAFGLDTDALPRIVPNARPRGGRRGEALATTRLLGPELPITGLCVDQQAALFGHGCFAPGQVKVTYGTGCFVLANIGERRSLRSPGLLTCVAWQIDDERTFALDGGVYSAGSLANWLVVLGLSDSVQSLSDWAESTPNSAGVFLIPAFSGLAAPHWQGRARAAWVGMSTGTDRRHLIRAALESIAYRVKDICDAITADDGRDNGIQMSRIQADGGLTGCRFLMQHQADVLALPVICQGEGERTALGVGYMAGLGCGLWPGIDALPVPHDDSHSYRARRTREALANYRDWCRVRDEIASWPDRGVLEP